MRARPRAISEDVLRGPLLELLDHEPDVLRACARHDEERIVQKTLDIKEYTDTAHDVMIPHTIVLGRNLEIYKVYNGYYYWGRPSVGELHGDLRDLTKSTQRDWDITDSELRDKWARGEKEDFYPYGKDSVTMTTLMRQMAGAIDQYAGTADDG